MSAVSKYINIDEPRYDQNTYIGRAKHFFITTNPLNILVSNKELENAKDVVESYRKTKVLPPGVDEEKLWRSKVLMDSAYHPDTKEKMFILGRWACFLSGGVFVSLLLMMMLKLHTLFFNFSYINNYSAMYRSYVSTSAM